MSKAEKRACQYTGYCRNQSYSDFLKGYEQAEEDLKLTIEDIKKIHTFLYAVKNNKQGAFTFTRLSDEKYQEVLKRFNERRNK